MTRTVVAGVLACAAASSALIVLRGTRASERERSDTPAASAMPAIKLRLFYGALALDGALMLLRVREAVLYLTLLLVFASVPILGHQTIGLTPVRATSSALHRWWILGLIFAPLVVSLGVVVLGDSAP